MARYTRPVYNTVDVFAAACAAQRINGEYLKQDDVTVYDDDHEYSHKVNRVANKTLTHQFLKGDFDITDGDREMAEKVMTYCRGLTFKLLTNKRLSDFEATMLTIVEKSTTDSNYDIAVVASLPASYERSIARTEQNIRLRETEGFVGQVGDKVGLSVEVVRCNFSDQWGTHFVTTITPDNKQVFFAFRNSLAVGDTITIEGKVKAHRNQREDSTQLNYVKVL